MGWGMSVMVVTSLALVADLIGDDKVRRSYLNRITNANTQINNINNKSTLLTRRQVRDN